MSAAPSLKPGASITELVVQGIRRFGEVRRFNFGPGYNVLYGLTAAGKSTIYDVLLSLLFAKPESEEASFRSLLPQGKTACRAGMTMTVGGETFRVLKDYLQGTVTLSRLMPDKKFQLVHSDPRSIQRWLTESALLTVGPPFSRLFAIAKNDLPSTTEDAGSAARRDMVDSGFEDRLRTMPLAEKRALLLQFQDEFRRHAEAKTTEFLQDGLRSRLYEVEALLQKREAARMEIAEIQAEVKDIEKVPRLPDGFAERLENYIRHEKTREAELAALHERQDDAHAGLANVIPPPYTEEDMRAMKTPQQMITGVLKKDVQLAGGVAALPVGLILAIFFHKPLNMIGMLFLVAGVGLVVWRGLLVFLKGKEQFDLLRRDVDSIDEQVRVIEKKWEIETTVIRNLTKAYKVEDPRDLPEIAKRRDDLVAKRSALQQTMAGLVLPSGETDLDAARAKIAKQIETTDQHLQEISGNFTVDPKDLEPQIERLDREVSRAEGRRPTDRSELFGREEDAAVSSGNAIVTVVNGWCGTRRADTGRLLRAIQEAFGKNLRALSGGRLTDGTFDAEGSALVREEGRPPSSFDLLDGAAKDFAYLSLRLTLFQLETRGANPLVALLDDPFDFEEGRLAAISRALKALGSGAQVFHLTSRPGHAKFADHTIEI